MPQHRIYVKLKSSDEIVSGKDILEGPLPKTGDERDVELQSGRIIKARIGSPHTPPSKMSGTPGIQVYADEI
jgi:hypothetical protein